MTAKIRELKHDDIENVSGGRLAASTATATFTSTSTVAVRPIRPISGSLTRPVPATAVRY